MATPYPMETGTTYAMDLTHSMDLTYSVDLRSAWM